MAVSIKWFPDHCVIEYSDIINIKESVEAYGEIVGSSNFDNIIFIVADCRKLVETRYEVKDYEIHAAISKSSSLMSRRDMKVAAVVSDEKSEQAVKNLITALKKYPHNWQRKIFWDYDEAIAWART